MRLSSDHDLYRWDAEVLEGGTLTLEAISADGSTVKKYYMLRVLAGRQSEVLRESTSDESKSSTSPSYRFAAGFDSETVLRFVQFVCSRSFDYFNVTNTDATSLPSTPDSSGTDSSGTDSSGTDSSGTDSSGTDSSGTDDEGEFTTTHNFIPDIFIRHPALCADSWGLSLEFPYSIDRFMEHTLERSSVTIHEKTKLEMVERFQKNIFERQYDFEHEPVGASRELIFTAADRRANLIGFAKLYVLSESMVMKERVLQSICLSHIFDILWVFNHDTDEFSTLADLVDVIYEGTREADECRKLLAEYIALFKEHLQSQLCAIYRTQPKFEEDVEAFGSARLGGRDGNFEQPIRSRGVFGGGRIRKRQRTVE